MRFRFLSRKASLVPVCLFVTLFVTACGKHEPVRAVGPNDEITVFTNTAPEGSVAKELRRLFSYPVDVVGPEAAFRLDFTPFHRFDIHRHVKNQIFAVDLSKKDGLAKAMPRILEAVSEEQLRAKKPFLALRRDFWATGQTSFFAVAWSRPDLLRLLATADSTQLRRSYENSVVAGLGKTMFAIGEERGISAQVARQFGWTMRLSPGFFAANHPKGRVVKFNAEDPVRLIMVYWEDAELPLEAEVWNPILSRILDVYNDGDFFMPERTDVFPGEFQDERSLEWEGVWQNEKYVIGGPFRAHAFNRDGKSFLLVGIVFAPGQDKVYVLRQVEALMATFRLVS